MLKSTVAEAVFILFQVLAFSGRQRGPVAGVLLTYTCFIAAFHLPQS